MTVDDDEPVTPSDRRIGVRHFACFPAHVQRPDGATRTAMIHDLSMSGVRLVVGTLLQVDDRISLQLYVNGDPQAPSRATPGRVVRVEPLDPSAVGPWTHRVAVQFDEPLTDFQDEILALAEHQKQLGFGR